MNEIVQGEKKLTTDLYDKLLSLRAFLIGDKPIDKEEEVGETCMQDVMLNNTKRIDSSLNILNQIETIIIGGKN